MKLILKITTLLLLCSGIYAQRVDLDKFTFNHRYTRLPDNALDPSYTTYSVNVNKTVALDYYSNESVNNMINIQGRKKVNSPGHLQININMEDLMIESSEVKERVEVRKDKDGKETGRSYYYKVEVIYSFQADASVKDYTGKQLRTYALSAYREKKNYSTAEYSKSSDAVNFYNNNKLEIKTQLVSGEINKAISSLNSSLNYNFGYMAITSSEHLWVLGSKKHEEYATYVEKCGTFKNILESMTPTSIPEAVNTQVQQTVDYFIQLADKYADTEDKGQKKLRYGAFYNLAIIYFYTEQFDKAIEYANRLIANDYDSKDGEKIIKDIKSVQDDFVKHGINTRHFVREVENAQPPQ